MDASQFPPQFHLSSFVSVLSGIPPCSLPQRNVMCHIHSPGGPAALLRSPNAITNLLAYALPQTLQFTESEAQLENVSIGY